MAALLCLALIAPAEAGEPAGPRCRPGGVLAPPGSPAPAKVPCRQVPLRASRSPGAAGQERRPGGDVPLPRKAPLSPEDDDSIALTDGVSLTGRLGPRDQAGNGGLDGVTNKRTAIVPRGAEESPGTVLKHGASDGVSLGLSFDFETK
ncbi:MAG: hypothetical protein U1E62_11785 [Alsobacter sp.]